MKKLDRICISNIAWPSEADREAVRLVAEIGYAGIEIAPAKTFGGWQDLNLGAAAPRKAEISRAISPGIRTPFT